MSNGLSVGNNQENSITRVEGGQEMLHHNGKLVINMLIKDCASHSLVWPRECPPIYGIKDNPRGRKALGGYYPSLTPRQYHARLKGEVTVTMTLAWPSTRPGSTRTLAGTWRRWWREWAAFQVDSVSWYGKILRWRWS